MKKRKEKKKAETVWEDNENKPMSIPDLKTHTYTNT